MARAANSAVAPKNLQDLGELGELGELGLDKYTMHVYYIYIYMVSHIHDIHILHILYSYVVFFSTLFVQSVPIFFHQQQKDKSEAFTFLLHLIVGQVNLLALKKNGADF